MDAKKQKAVVDALVQKFPKADPARITQGVAQVASLWRASDGDLQAFALEQLIDDDKKRAQTFQRFEAAMEQLDGHFLEITRELKRATDTDIGPLLPVDTVFSGWDASAHVTDDLFASKLAFVALLNFPMSTLEERVKAGPSWTRDQWAMSRLTQRFARRVPADVNKKAAEVQASADLYIAEYNIWMHHVLDASGNRVFPSGKRLISHWNLRDELKAQYANGAEGANRQRVIVKLMERIVTQTIPADVVNNPRVDWNPFSNDVKAAPAEEIEKDAPAEKKHVDGPEPNTRYAQLLAQFNAQKAADPYSPTMPNAIKRAFEQGREMPEARVKQLLEDVLTSPLVPQVAGCLTSRNSLPIKGRGRGGTGRRSGLNIRWA